MQAKPARVCVRWVETSEGERVRGAHIGGLAQGQGAR